MGNDAIEGDDSREVVVEYAAVDYSFAELFDASEGGVFWEERVYPEYDLLSGGSGCGAGVM